MLQQISKKILIYFFLLLILGTINNKFLSNISFPKIKDIKINGLDENENIDFFKKFEEFKSYDLFFLKRTEVDKKINSNKLIEKYSVSKVYPSTLIIKLKKAKFLGNIRKNGEIFFVGSNGKLINAKIQKKELPFIFGKFDFKNFFTLKKDIDNSLFNYEQIENLFIFPSGRWDIETKSGILIKLPKDRQKESLDLFSKLIKNPKFENLKVIDFRQKNQVIVNE